MRGSKSVLSKTGKALPATSRTLFVSAITMEVFSLQSMNSNRSNKHVQSWGGAGGSNPSSPVKQPRHTNSQRPRSFHHADSHPESSWGSSSHDSVLEGAQKLVRAVLGKSKTLSRESCDKALATFQKKEAEHKKLNTKLEKAKTQRNAMAEPLKRLTLELQTASKDRKETKKLMAKQEEEIERLKQELSESQHAAEDYKEEKNVLQLQVIALVRQTSFRNKAQNSNATMSFADGASTFISAITSDDLPGGSENNDESLNFLDDIENMSVGTTRSSRSAAPEDSPEPGLDGEGFMEMQEKLQECLEQIGMLQAELDGARLSVKERDHKMEILEEYLMDESGVKNPVSYLTVQLTFYATSALPEAEERMEDILTRLRMEGTKVDIIMWNNFMKFWAASGMPEAPEKMEYLVECMRKECVDPDVGTWNQFMTFWALSGSPKAHDKMETLLQGMADDSIQPDVNTWNIFAKTPGKDRKR